MREFQWNKNGMKQILDSPHKTWNKQTVALCTGNVWDSGYFSNYIRPWNKLECNGRINEQGHLQNFDLNHYKSLPLYIRNYFKFEAKESLVLMEVFTHNYSKNKRYGNEKIKVVHGYIIYDENYENGKHEVKVIKKCYMNNNWKSIDLIDWICDAITEEEEND